MSLQPQQVWPAMQLTEHGTLNLTGKSLHFLGIGGSGMNGLARMCLSQGARVTGVDVQQSVAVAGLIDAGIEVTLSDQKQADWPSHHVDAVVASAAVPDTHPTVLEANRRGAPVLRYAQMLGLIMLGRQSLAVAGTHGKSTTTSMLSHILIQCQVDPSVIVGAQCQQIGGGFRVGQSDVLVAEACEYARSFHWLFPAAAVILNVEADHLDYYAGLDEIIESFATFAERLPREGVLLIHHDMVGRTTIAGRTRAEVQTIGYSPAADWYVRMEQSKVMLSRRPDASPLVTWQNPMPGQHMAYNTACAAVLAANLGCPWDQIAKAIESFTGVDRRMQRIGSFEKAGSTITVLDDYAHHPTEIDTTLRALREHYRPGRLIVVFQPHQHSRTRFLLDQFASSFSEADQVIVPDIYFVRDSEEERKAVTSQDLVDRMMDYKTRARYVPGLDAITSTLIDELIPGDLVVTMGAGDVWKVGRLLLEQAQSSSS